MNTSRKQESIFNIYLHLQTTEISTSIYSAEKMQEVSGKVEPDIFQPKQQRSQ